MKRIAWLLCVGFCTYLMLGGWFYAMLESPRGQMYLYGESGTRFALWMLFAAIPPAIVLCHFLFSAKESRQ